jgi:hypothetical protein
MPQFSPDQCTFKDDPGMGVWDNSHYREHLQFVQVLSMQTTPVVIPDADFLQMLTAGNVRKQILDSHTATHNLLRQITGVPGVDYSTFDLDKETDFYNWLGVHATEHSQIRQVLGIV